jgi:predicted patatin/cPLA2 family phospholipase
MPILYNRWTVIRDEPLVDGGVSNNIPLIDAMNTGCRDVLAIVTKPLGDRHDGIYGIKRILYRMLMGKYSTDFKLRFLNRDELYNRSSALLDGSIEADTNIFVMHPSDPGRLVSRATTSRKELLDCAMMGVNDCRRYFGKPEIENIPFGTD